MDRVLRGIALLLLSATTSGCEPDLSRRVAATPETARPARSLSPEDVRRTCTELRSFFDASAAGLSRAKQLGGYTALRAWVDTTLADSSEFFMKGTGAWIKYSPADIAAPSSPEDTARDARFEYRYVSVSVGLASDREALFVLRFVEFTTEDYVQRAGRRPYVSAKAGRVVRLPQGWRILQQVSMSDHTGLSDGLSDSALRARTTDWECR